MNECFHAKCGERAREAPVCPACKHNNTDVSIHQVDPGKACRDLEKCLSRRHVDRIPLPNPLPYPPPSPSPSLSLSFLLPTLRGAVSNAISIFPARFIALSSPCHRRGSRAPARALPTVLLSIVPVPKFVVVRGNALPRSISSDPPTKFRCPETLEIRENADDRTRLKHSRLFHSR